MVARIPRSVRTGGLSLLGLFAAWGCLSTDPIPVPVGTAPVISDDGQISSERLGVSGYFYVYGDAYGNPRSCVDVGKHSEQSCSSVESPAVHSPNLGFPNENGEMCVFGEVAEVLPCCKASFEDDPEAPEECHGENVLSCSEKTASDLDHSSMWGAGIGFDLALDPKDSGNRDYGAIHSREPWNASEHRVVGISFELNWHRAGGPILMRVEFPMQIKEQIQLPPDRGTLFLGADGQLQEILPGGTLPAGSSTEWHPFGSPFWQEPNETEWKASPIKQGYNEIFWEDVFPPPETMNNYLRRGEFTGDGLYGVQFHVIPQPDETNPGSVDFSFCIQNLKFLTEE
jgi:hypothetical protein